MAMARIPAITRLLPAAALLACSLPALIGHAAPAVAAVPQRPQRPLLAVPSAMLRRPSVPVIVEMNSPGAAALLARSPLLANLLANVRLHLLDVLRLDHASDVYTFHLVPDIAATVPGTAIQGLLAQPGVRAIVLDRQHTMLPLPSVANVDQPGVASSFSTLDAAGPFVDVGQTVEPESFGLTRANVAQAHGYDGAGVRVAIIDSGLDLSQPDLAGVAATDAHGVPLRVDFTGTDLKDTVGHGTACASMIASQGRVVYSGDNHDLIQVYPQPSGHAPVYRSHFHVYGMAPGVRLMSAKIFDTRVPNGSGGYDSWIVRAIEWAVDHHADVISESFGGPSVPGDGTDPTAQADQAAVRAGVTVVAANGNEGPGQTTVSSPANAPGVIAVGASTEYRTFGQTGFLAPFGRTTNDNIASFTSRGPTTDGRPRPDLVAPGAFSWALFPISKSQDGPTKPPYDVGTFGGTSKATPVTAGAAALVIGAFRKAHGGVTPSPEAVRSILMSAAHDLGYPAFDEGAGRLDAWEAVQTAVHSGPSFQVGPNSLALAGPTAAPIAHTFALTNTGSTIQRYTFDATQSHRISIQDWFGDLSGTQLRAYHFTVVPGRERIVGAVYWNSVDRFTVGSASKAVAMRVALYDPLGRFVNYSYGVGSGYAEAQAAHPMSGTWTMVISENGSKDTAGVRHYTHEAFQARLNTFVTQPYGTLSLAAVTLAPGHSAHITLNGRLPAQAGAYVATVHVHGDHTANIPVALTSYITFAGSSATFSSAFTGPTNQYFSLANENKVFSLNVPAGTHSLNVNLSWPDTGYGVFLLLVDPNGAIVDGQFNGISNGSIDSPFDLSAHDLEAIWSNPVPGRWQIVVMGAVFSGAQRVEPFTGHVTFNDTPVTPLAITRTVVPGSNVAVDLHVRNHNGPNVAEGYVGYATTDAYGNIPLGTLHGPFGSSHINGSDVYTYTTSFVPPGTKMVVSQVAVIHPSVVADLSISDPVIGYNRAVGQSGPVAIDGHTYQGATAVISGRELGMGTLQAQVTLRRPFDAHKQASIVASSYAYALTPSSWATFDHGLQQGGRITGGQPLILLPGQTDALHASVTVPLNTPPGVYHLHLFVISLFADQVANVPLTIVVQPQTGVEPAAKTP